MHYISKFTLKKPFGETLVKMNVFYFFPENIYIYIYIYMYFLPSIQQFVLPNLLCSICKRAGLYGEQRFSLNGF